MCLYCVIGDHHFKYDPPFRADPIQWPTIPQPAPNVVPKEWPVERLREYLELLKEVKALEDKLGCPCEPNKAEVRCGHGLSR